MTSVINEVLEAVIGMMNDTNPFATVTRGALPTNQGLVCEIGPSIPDELYFDKNTVIPLDVTLNGKSKNLKTLTDAMNGIHSALTRTRVYPSSERWQIIDIQNQNLPEIIDREQNNDWLSASALTVRFFWKGD
jgi:hypothetical protein